MAIERKDSFVRKAAGFLHEHPYIFRAVMGSAAVVTGAFTGGLGAAAVGVAWVAAENIAGAIIAKELENSKKENENDADAPPPEKVDNSGVEAKIFADKKEAIKGKLADNKEQKKGETNEADTTFRDIVVQQRQSKEEHSR